MKLTKHVSAIAFIFLSTCLSADEYCPTLTTANLAEAACSTEAKLFKTDPASRIGFYADRPCPWGLGTKKWLQSWKKESTYEGKATEHEDGVIKCGYKLWGEKNWIAYTGRNFLSFDIVVNTLPLADYWSTHTQCPALTHYQAYYAARPETATNKIGFDPHVVSLRTGGKELKMTISVSPPEKFDPGLMNGEPPTEKLQAMLSEVEKGLSVKCEYSYKGSEAEPQKFQLISKWPETRQAK